MLLYANRATQPGLQFKVHGQLAVTDLQVVDSEPRMGADFCFNIYDGKRALMVAAATQEEKTQWMEDITETVQVLYCTVLYCTVQFTAQCTELYSPGTAEQNILLFGKFYLSTLETI